MLVGDVQAHLEAIDTGYDLILMDTDNGPDSLVRAANIGLYQDGGLGAVARSLGPKGVVAFWSATASPEFERRLSAQPWFWLRDDIAPIPGRADVMHYIYSCSFSAAALGQRKAA